LLTRTEEFDDAAWTKVGVSVTTSAELNPLGAAQGVFRLSGASGNLFQSVATIGVSQTISFWVKSNGGGLDTFRLRIGGAESAVLTATNDWVRYTYHVPSPGSSVAAIRTDGTGSIDVLIWGAQLELGSTATDYQKVTSTYDVTEAGQADNYHLVFDGVDDFMQTPSIDFTGTDEMSVFAGVRKLVDAGAGVVAELSVNSETNTSTFAVLSSALSGGADRLSYGAILQGGAAVFSASRTYIAPTSNVVTNLFDLGQATAATEITTRVDGVIPASRTLAGAADAGTGNFGNYPLYIGRRGGSSLPLNGHLYSLIVRGALTADNLLNQTETYVASKTAGVEL
jgi:hypothetical protein